MIDLQPDLHLTTSQADLVLGAWLDGPVACTGIVPLRGGMVNSVFRLEFDRPPHHAVIKVHGREGSDFAAEASALAYLAAETNCPVPSVHLHDESGRLVPHAFLLLEELPGVCLAGLDLEPTQRVDLEHQLAAALGELHDHRGTAWGSVDGTDAGRSWAELFGERLAETRAHPAVTERLSADVVAGVDGAIARVGEELDDSGPPTLVHGDVWDGNVMVHHDGERWRLSGLLDPALQFADVELELAYLEVFDTPRDAFFEAYTKHRPRRAGYERRRLFYWLHTALVHVALFGDDVFCDFAARTARKIGARP
jgi:fructosamine-3-kinase